MDTAVNPQTPWSRNVQEAHCTAPACCDCRQESTTARAQHYAEEPQCTLPRLGVVLIASEAIPWRPVPTCQPLWFHTPDQVPLEYNGALPYSGHAPQAHARGWHEHNGSAQPRGRREGPRGASLRRGDDCGGHASVVAGVSCGETARSQGPIHLKVSGRSPRDPQRAVDVQHLELPEWKLQRHGHWDRWDRECLSKDLQTHCTGRRSGRIAHHFSRAPI